MVIFAKKLYPVRNKSLIGVKALSELSIRVYRGWILIAVISICSFLLAGESYGIVRMKKEYNPVAEMGDLILSYFYSASGMIVGIEKNHIITEITSDKELKKCTQLSVFRKGKTFYHPVTKQPLGKSEQFIGWVEVKEFNNGRYLTKVVSGSPQSGDIVRTPSSRIKLAIFLDKNTIWALSDALCTFLTDSERFNLITMPYTKTSAPEELSKLARGRGAEASLLFSTHVDGENVFLNLKLIRANDASVFAEIEQKVGRSLVEELGSENKPIPFIPVKGLSWGSYELAGGKFIAMGDVDGDGEKELVVSDGSDIRIYRYKSSDPRLYKKELQEIWFLKGSHMDNHLSIDVIDLNNNGRAEIFVTSMRNEDTMNSFVIEYEPLWGYKKIMDKLPYAMRVIEGTLLMQAFTPYGGITGPVYTGVWKDGSYQPDKPLKLPQGIDIYGFTFIDGQSKGYQYLFGFNDNGYLNLYRDDELIWKSKDSYGRFDVGFKKKTDSLVNPEEKWFMKGRLMPIKTPRGQEVIVTKKVPYIANMPGLGHKKTEVYSLWWDGEVMQQTLIPGGITGTVTDYLLEADTLLIIARQGLFMFFKKAISGGNYKRGSVLYYYNLKGK